MEVENNNINNESLDSQISRLANFIMENIEGEPSQSEGAVDCAIRIMVEMKVRAEKAEEMLDEAIKHIMCQAEGTHLNEYCPFEHDCCYQEPQADCDVLIKSELARRTERTREDIKKGVKEFLKHLDKNSKEVEKWSDSKKRALGVQSRKHTRRAEGE